MHLINEIAQWIVILALTVWLFWLHLIEYNAVKEVLIAKVAALMKSLQLINDRLKRKRI